MRRHLVRWGIVVAAIATAGALPAGGPQRINLGQMPEAVSTVKSTVYRGHDDDRTQRRGGELRTPARPERY